MTGRRIGVWLAAVTLAVSGAYLFVYLYRWEWNRALVAGVFVLATEVGLTAQAVLGRLRALEAELARGQAVARPQVLHRLRETAPPPRRQFAWLRPETNAAAVFVPMLMGVGFLFSALAWAVERLARATARPTLERRLAARLAPFTLPEGHLVAPGDAEPDGLPGAVAPPAMRRALATGAGVVAAAAGLFALAEATQNRPDVVRSGTATELVLDVRGRRLDPAVAASSLVAACLPTIGRGTLSGPTAAGDHRFVVVVRPALGRHASRRFLGCLEDATVDRAWAGVVARRDVADGDSEAR